MRIARWLPALASLALIAGCTRWSFLNKGPEPKQAPVTGEAHPVAAYVDYLNDNARRIDTVRCTDIDLTCSQGFQSLGLRGKMVAQKAHNFSMSSDLIGKSFVEVGSNDKEFWYWISKADPPYVYCSYDDLKEGRVKQMPFPFQPTWIMETMGMGSYGPPDRYRLEADGNTVKLVEQTVAQGKAMRKIIVMNRRAVQAPTPQVTAFLLVDEASGKEICSAHISETQLDRNTGAVIPRRLEFRWPEQSFKLAMKLNGAAVNAEVPATAFVRRPRPGIPAYDLGKGRLEQASADVQRVQSVR